MSQNNLLHKNFLFSSFLVFLTIAVALAGCTDSLLYNNVEIPDAEVVIKGEIAFKPLITTEVQTRSRAEAPDGEKYKGIKSLYVAFFDSEGQIMTDYTGDVSFKSVPSQSETHQRVQFEKKVQAGRYYIYAIANLSLSDEDMARFRNIKTIDELRAFKVDWDDDIAKDLEMFGIFKQDDQKKETIPDNERFETEQLLTITPATKSIYSWVRRTTSKVTVDFDGSNLKEGVTVYIKSAVLKDVPKSVCIGYNSAVGGDSIAFADRQSDYSLTYGAGESHISWPQVTKTSTFTPQNIWGDQSVGSFHADAAPALPCYENMQGEPEGKSKLQDSNGDGLIDSSDKDGVDNGTYLEVTGYYVANRPEYKSQGDITYRFMLGNDAVKNFDFVRNHHYKITMCFKGYGNDIDWHIVYADKYLNVTYPDSVNYQGKFFVPDADYNNIPNAGHKFSDKNVITVTSFEKDNVGKHWIDPDISYTYYNYDDATGTWEPDNTEWLTLSEIKQVEGEDIDPQKQYTFTAAMSEPVTKLLNTSSAFPSTSLGTQSTPYNLSNKDGKSMVIENTANSYMVGAPGWYCFPLVYGNAITGKGIYTQAYASPHMLNHLGQHITHPYIKDDVSLSDVSVKLIWQDADNLIETSADRLIYDPGLFGGIGGIKFHIGTIQEGNAVIALIDNTAAEDPLVNIKRPTYGKSGSTKAIWSWHIWVTRFGFDGFGDDLQIINHEEKAFDVMPVNLGWCAGAKGIKYYKRRKCDITFKVGEHEIVRTILQYPHMLLPRGDHPYYQWGRKDPFVGTNLAGGNKPRWNGNGDKYYEWSQYNPPRLYDEPEIFADNAGRKHTKECLAALVQNPDKWHNAPRKPLDPNNLEDGFYSINESYDDLWSYNDAKTVYDPCPPGYQVSDHTPFTGFTTSGTDEVVGLNWLDVLEINMQTDYYAGSPINAQVIEFYTDMRKIQSITFPISGYRDYDKNAGVVNYPSSNEKNEWYNGEGFVWFNTAKDFTNSFHLKFQRNDFGEDADQLTAWKTRGGIVAVGKEKFYNTDGFGVRPVRIK